MEWLKSVTIVVTRQGGCLHVEVVEGIFVRIIDYQNFMIVRTDLRN